MGALKPRRLSRAADHSTNRLILAAYLWHPMPWVARVAATNPRTPKWAVRRARNQERLVDIVLADPNSDADTLLHHAQDADTSPALLHLIVQHSNATGNVLTVAAFHPRSNVSVLTSLIQHPECHTGLATQLVIEAEKAPGQPYSDRQSCQIQQAALTRDDLDVEALTWLAHNCSNDAVLALVAQHPNTLEEDAVAAALKADFSTLSSSR